MEEKIIYIYELEGFKSTLLGLAIYDGSMETLGQLFHFIRFFYLIINIIRQG